MGFAHSHPARKMMQTLATAEETEAQTGHAIIQGHACRLRSGLKWLDLSPTPFPAHLRCTSARVLPSDSFGRSLEAGAKLR
jgi:hypothetical protein